MSRKLAFSAALSVLLSASALLVETTPAEVPFGGDAAPQVGALNAGGSGRSLLDTLFSLVR